MGSGYLGGEQGADSGMEWNGIEWRGGGGKVWFWFLNGKEFYIT